MKFQPNSVKSIGNRGAPAHKLVWYSRRDYINNDEFQEKSTSCSDKLIQIYSPNFLPLSKYSHFMPILSLKLLPRILMLEDSDMKT